MAQQNIRSLSQAFDYVNERYRFTGTEYPGLQKLNLREGGGFKAKHILLHMQKAMKGILFHSSDDLGNISRVKMLVNILKLAKLTGITGIEIEMHARTEYNHSIEDFYLEYMADIASQCERCDHGKDIDVYVIQKSTIKMLQLWVGNTSNVKSKSKISFGTALRMIPKVMASKKKKGKKEKKNA